MTRTAPAPAPAAKLVTADLAAAQRRALALQTEARRERSRSPDRAARLQAQAKASLDAIAAEKATRDQLQASYLSDGTSAAALATSLRTTPEADLRALVSSPSTAPDDQLRATVAGRELARRADVAASIAQQFERTRLDTLKRDFARTLQGLGARDLKALQKTEHTELAQAQHAVSLAREQLAAASTPAARAGAGQVLASAERALRDEYTRTAALDARAPVTLDHRALHAYADGLKGLTPDALQAERAVVQARRDDGARGAIRASRLEQATDTVKLAIIDQALARAAGKPGTASVGGTAPVRGVDATRNPGNVVFDGPGAMVADASKYPASQYAAKLKAAGVQWVTLQINNGGPNAKNVAQLDAGWADQWRAAGFKVGFWGVSTTEPERDAREAAQLTAKYHGDFYIADCEGSFQDGEGDVGRNARFVNAFQDEAQKQGIGDLPRALSSMGRVALDMKPWINGGWDAMPQAYWNSYEHYQPSKCVQFYEDWGWPKDRIHPTIATYDGSSEGNARPKSLAEYSADLATTGTHGFSYYLPEDYLGDQGYAQLGQMIHPGVA
ncbi:MAG: hypothetical protein K1X89_27515 [Myxococcaceae bacterium]|nr:hypothetical protein [Myxococcaceae bacterium]